MRDLTIRGRCFLAAGLAAIVSGVQVGERDFVQLGLLALFVPLGAWLVLRRTDRELWVRREIEAARVEVGSTTEVVVKVGRSGVALGRRAGALVLEERLPEGLGQPPQFVVESLSSGEPTRLDYRIRAEQRGRFPIGPMHVRVADPTGMVDLHQVLPSTTTILVTPRTEPLPALSLTGRWSGAGDHRTRDLLGSGSPDVTIREYRVGDDLRRVHWPSSARVSQLMVRREEQQWQSRCTLLVDNRRRSHRGHGQASSLETGVSVAASLTRHLVGQDFDVRLISATGDASTHGRHLGDQGADLSRQLERLALMGLSRVDQLDTRWVDERQQGGMLLAVLGHLDRVDREFLAGLAAAGAAAYAVVLDVEGWDRHSTDAPPATEWLRSHGWKATTLRRGEPLTPSWLELAR
ncbi:MAG: DUF58 domain-containing protein [Marmoricola sp.]